MVSSNNNINLFREYIKTSDLEDLIERKFYVESDIFQSNMTYVVKILEKLSANPDLINYFFTKDLCHKLNSSSIKEIYSCLIQFYFENKKLGLESYNDYEDIIRSLTISNDLKTDIKNVLKTFMNSETIKEIDEELSEHLINYYSSFLQKIFI